MHYISQQELSNSVNNPLNQSEENRLEESVENVESTINETQSTGQIKPYEELEKARFGILQQYLNAMNAFPGAYPELVKFGAVWDRSAGPADSFFRWGLIEKSPGEYDWSETDKYVKWCGENRRLPVAVIWPYAEWDQVQTYGGYYQKVPGNLDAYKEFVKKLVERYDGDGIDDMPGLIYPIKYWEVLNEVTTRVWGGTVLGFFNGTAEEYYKILKITYEAIKEADPEAKVLNAGIADMTIGNEYGEIECRAFYSKVFELGGANYFDIANIHWIYNLDAFIEFLHSYNIKKPIWITEAEFAQTWTGKSVEEAVIDIVKSFWKGVEKIIIVPPGPGDMEKAPLIYDGLKTMIKQINYFDYIEKINDNCYKFIAKNKIVYILWNSSIPDVVYIEANNITIIDVYGRPTSIDGNYVSGLVYIVEYTSYNTSKAKVVNSVFCEEYSIIAVSNLCTILDDITNLSEIFRYEIQIANIKS